MRLGDAPLALVGEAAVNSTRPRFDRLDALRGAAVLWMVGFHFCYDLSYFRVIEQNFYSDPFWTTQRIAIVSLFLFCAGLGQAVAKQQGQGWPRFWKRWAQVAGCALLVSVGSWFVFRDRFISFGVLHAVALMLLVLRGMFPLKPPALALVVFGAVAMLLPLVWQHPFFDSRLTNWVGLVTRKPATEDFVPLLPWIGVMAWGRAAGQWLLQYRPQFLSAQLPAPLQPFAVLGRWSLSIYMLHQPVLFGLLIAFLWLKR